ncbi:hypothetical protein BN1708_020559, partial [Verticillium longisporum]
DGHAHAQGHRLRPRKVLTRRHGLLSPPPHHHHHPPHPRCRRRKVRPLLPRRRHRH